LNHIQGVGRLHGRVGRLDAGLVD